LSSGGISSEAISLKTASNISDSIHTETRCRS
jgi:hypothetical protein